MLGKKRKISTTEIERAREERITATAEKLKVQILSMENKKEELVSKVIEAKRKGLPAQEQQARGLLKRCIASQKQASGMLMTLELAVQSRDLASLNMQFLECIGNLSDDMRTAAKKSNAKQAEKKYLKAMYASQQQSAELDKMLDIGDYAAVASIGSDKFGEFDTEIDALVEHAEAFGVTTTQKQKLY